jgi:DNA-binding MarR family transcriptional regulator
VTVSPEQHALVALLRAEARLRRQLDDVPASQDLSRSQYNVLRILRGAGDSLPVMTVRDRMIDRLPSITRLLDRLEARGLLERTPSTEDRRRVDCRVTQAGLALLAELDEPIDAADRAVMSQLSASELKTLKKLLDRVGRVD